MRVDNIKVYDLEESMVASGYPMMTDLGMSKYEMENLEYWLNNDLVKVMEVVKNLNIKVLGNVATMTSDDGVEYTISCEDIIKVSNKKWSYNKSRGYIRSTTGEVELHRYIMDEPTDMCVDHKDRNKLNYTRDNLRICTHRENSINKGIIPTNTSGVTGVYWVKDKNKWQSKLECNKKRITLGSFTNKTDAIKARLTAENEYFGEFAPQRHLFEEYGVKITEFKCVDGNEYILSPSLENAMRHMKRAMNLAHTDGNAGHNQFLTGVRVAFDLTFTNKAWVELERYRFVEFVSSQSTMHRISKFDVGQQVNKYVTQNTIDEVNRLRDIYLQTGDKEDYLRLLYNIPSGFELTARLTTNYRALKTVYSQRRTHRLPEWREFCKWVETLPYFKELVLREEN